MRIAVIGAGIGGLATAAGLQRDGHDTVVLEERDDPTATGSGLTLFGNAFAALDVLGIGDRVRAVTGTTIATMRAGHRATDGDWLATAPASATATLRSVHRADLHGALTAALAPGTLRPGAAAPVEDAERRRVRVVADGRSATSGISGGGPSTGPGPSVTGAGTLTGEYDLVVAADGIRSPARAALGDDPGLRYSGFTA